MCYPPSVTLSAFNAKNSLASPLTQPHEAPGHGIRSRFPPAARASMFSLVGRLATSMLYLKKDTRACIPEPGSGEALALILYLLGSRTLLAAVAGHRLCNSIDKFRRRTTRHRATIVFRLDRFCHASSQATLLPLDTRRFHRGGGARNASYATGALT